MNLADRLAVTTPEAAELCGYSESYIRRHIREGKLRAARPTGRPNADYRIMVEDLRAWARGEGPSANVASG